MSGRPLPDPRSIWPSATESANALVQLQAHYHDCGEASEQNSTCAFHVAEYLLEVCLTP